VSAGPRPRCGGAAGKKRGIAEKTAAGNRHIGGGTAGKRKARIIRQRQAFLLFRLPDGTGSLNGIRAVFFGSLKALFPAFQAACFC